MEKLKRVVIKEEFVALTGDIVDALILNQFIYWSQRISDFDKFILEEKRRAEHNGQIVDMKLSNGWIYKTAEELSEEIMVSMSVTNMRNHIKKLIQNGWIDERVNPENKWDKTKQYRVNLHNINNDLLKIGYMLQDYRIDISTFLASMKENDTYSDNSPNTRTDESSLRSHETSLPTDKTSLRSHATSLPCDASVTAIPEITTEITTENIYSQSVCHCDNGQKGFKNGQNDGHAMPNLNPKTLENNSKCTTDGYSGIIKQCELDKFSPEQRDIFSLALEKMYFAELLNINGVGITQPKIRMQLQNLNFDAISYAFEKFTSVPSGSIKNSLNYLITCIYNSISEYKFAKRKTSNSNTPTSSFPVQKPSNRQMPSNMTNFKQREYDEAYYDCLYEN